MESSDEHPSLLVLILDLNPQAWAALELRGCCSLRQTVASALVFLNAHLALFHANRVAVIGANCNGAQLIFPKDDGHDGDGDGDGDDDGHGDGHDDGHGHDEPLLRKSPQSGGYKKFSLLSHAVRDGVRGLMQQTRLDELAAVGGPGVAKLSGAFALALMYINRTVKDYAVGIEMLSRIVVIATYSDLSPQYVSIMNCIFAAQRQKVPIDVVNVESDPTPLLQQMSDATKGIFTLLSTKKERLGLLQTLLSIHLPDAITRKYLVAPTQLSVDFRTACICHKNVVDVGYVCSVCLSIFCNVHPRCVICGAKYNT